MKNLRNFEDLFSWKDKNVSLLHSSKMSQKSQNVWNKLQKSLPVVNSTVGKASSHANPMYWVFRSGFESAKLLC